MKIFAVAIQRGGTAKTTTAAAIVQAAAHRGKSALAIDLDPQGNLSFILKADTSGGGSYSLLTGEPAEHLIQHTPGGIDVIPASWNLAAIATSKGSARRLQKALQALKAQYDYIVIDTPPTAGELQYNALQAATDLIIPLQADILGLQGLYQIADTAQQIQRTNPELAIDGFILTRYNARSSIARYMTETITAKAAELGIPFLQAIREGVAIREAQTMQQSLFEYAPNSKPAADYLELFDRIQ